MDPHGPIVGPAWAAAQAQAADLPLHGWYADPAPAAEACAVLRHLAAAGPGLAWPARLAEAIARAALERPWEAAWMNLRALAPDGRAAALAELVRGQLLVARRLRAGRAHLEAGFRLAAPHLDARGYLVLLRRHARLAALPLSETPRPPAPLAALLAEAGVAARLAAAAGRARPRAPAPPDRCDTVG